jgi:septum formation protein
MLYLNNMQNLVLASKSPARASVLKAAGLKFEVKVADVNEERILDECRDLPFPEQVLELAKAKALAVANQIFDTKTEKESVNDSSNDDEERDITLVVGCDSMFEFQGELMGKPHTYGKALENILNYRGRKGVLHTGHAVVLVEHCQKANDDSEIEEGLATDGHQNELVTVGGTVSTAVNFANFSEDDAKAYVATREPLEVAGSFAIDGKGAGFIRGIEGDYHSVVGISPNALRELVESLDINYTDFWV